jgi:hypothetical protein
MKFSRSKLVNLMRSTLTFISFSFSFVLITPLKVEQEIQQQKKKEMGNLMIKDLSSVVKPHDVIQSDYLTSLLVV